jgi:hypothetical protein
MPKAPPPARKPRGYEKPLLTKDFYLGGVQFELAASEGEGLMVPRTPVLLPLSHGAIDAVVFEGRGAGEGMGWYWGVYGMNGMSHLKFPI